MTDPDNDIDFSGRVVVVTGGGNGIGRAHCLALASRRAKVIVNDVGASSAGKGRAQDAADRVVAEIRDAGGEAIPNYDSVSTRESGAAIVASAIKAFGRIDALVNNAGFLTDAPFDEMTDAQIDTIIDVHLKGAFYVSQPAFRAMKDAGYGRIVFTGSSSGMFGHAWHASYGAAKAGILGLMNVVALEGVPHGILANAIMPNAVTRISESVSKGFMDNKPFAETMTRVNFEPLLPSVKPEWAAPLVTYLASENCQTTHNVYSQAGNRYARVFIGVTEGWKSPGDQPPSPQAIGAHLSAIEDRTTYYLPMTNYEELAFVSPIEAA
jgi:NAD(P)-dependent dehydrogenase (short-subunit alcohol dehydrogenase family)